jgi:hypothetical protein
MFRHLLGLEFPKDLDLFIEFGNVCLGLPGCSYLLDLVASCEALVGGLYMHLT